LIEATKLYFAGIRFGTIPDSVGAPGLHEAYQCLCGPDDDLVFKKAAGMGNCTRSAE
jgi:hypothetical protein